MSSRAVRYSAIFLAMLFVMPTVLMFVHDSSVEAGIVQVTVFDGGLTDKELSFVPSQTNTTLGFKIPKASVLKDVSIDLEAKMASAPGQIFLDTREDFDASSPVNLNTTKVYGNAYLNEKADLSDDFNDGSLDLVNWSWTNTPQSSNENAGSGHLEVRSTADTNWWNNDQTGNYLKKDVNGNFMLTVKLSSTPDENFERAGLMLFNDGSNYVQLMYYWFNSTPSNGRRYVSTVRRLNGNDATGSGSVPMNSDPLWLRVTRHFDEIKTSYSNNGQVFTEHRTVPVNWPDTIQAGLLTTDGHANNNFGADYDYFKMTRFVENGTMTVDPFSTPFPVGRVNMDSDLEQLEYWESFEVSVRADPSAPWDTFVSGGDHTLSQAGQQFEMEVFLDGKGWTSPTFKSVTMNYYPESWPSDIEIDLGNDGSVEWQWNDTFSQSTNINNVGFIDAMNALKDSLPADGDGYVHIPMKVVSQTPGMILFKNLVIELFTGTAAEPPELLSPDDDVWISTLTPTFRLKALDPDADTLNYKLELSTDNFATTTHKFNQVEDKFGWSENEYLSEEPAEFEMYSSDQLQHGKAYKWRVTAFDGGWWSNYSQARILKVDVTLPSGKITDAGTSTPINREATATVTFSDEESDITTIECGLGTSKNKTDVVPMQEISHTNGVAQVHFINLSLENMRNYFFTARAKNGAGQWSMNHTSNGLKIDLNLDARPTVEILNPTNRSTVVGMLTISGTASDPDPGDSLELFVAIDNDPFEKALGDTLWSYAWDSTTVQDGEHSIFVKADDGMRESPTELVLVIVGNNRVTISDWSPKGDQEIDELGSLDLSVEIRDPASIFKSYTWLIDGVNVPNLDRKNFTYTTDYDDSGVHVIEVKAMGVGGTASHKWNVTVNNINRNPSAFISSPKDKTEFDIGTKVWFDAMGSKDVDGDKITYSWEFSDSKTDTGPKVSRKFNKVGSFKATLTVKDEYNATSTAEVKFTIIEETDIITTFTTMPVCLLPIIILVVIIAVVAAVILKKKKRTQQFEAKLIDDELTSPLTHYDPTPKQEGMEREPPPTEQPPVEQPPVAPPPEQPPSTPPYEPPPAKQVAAPPTPGPEPAPTPAPEPEPEAPQAQATQVEQTKPEPTSEEYGVVDEEASKSGPAWGGPSASPFEDSESQGGPAWAQDTEDDDDEAPARPAWAEKKEEDKEKE